MIPVRIDVFYPLPEGWGLCSACEAMLAQANLGESPTERGLEEYPPEWQAEYRRLSALIISLAECYRDKISIRIWDPRSLQGLLKSIRYGVRRYPTFIINGKDKLSGWEGERLEQQIRAVVNLGDSEI